ncbi:uncharacterized protein HMPREF1541_01336 [Cyphellophora europaea CBS 101466]|uniref:Enoyl reductase (ER) domain-containing protein n=1 Tax=Cyphellophora europaea (strain CBS 101466) TaxID=1220924 RepID=W2SET5_CYPE1|nr:uncharacterized protein HMPREF1541_01336 [Cyphellophora europaea CBS 101466]ETN47145.1 hypothetical protein HMPREF1541_01336 [Cyphellophora europaea CBS 101466]
MAIAESDHPASGLIPKTQRAWTVPRQGGDVVLDENYPVPTPGEGQVLVKVLYTGVCQSDLHTARGTATGPDGQPITNIKLPHVGGHEGVGRIVQFGPNTTPPTPAVKVGTPVGIRFLASVCHECDFCTSGREQHCPRAVNHLHHRDGSFQEWCVLDLAYLTVLPEDVDVKVMGPVLCAGLTAYKAVKNASLKQGDWLCVIGAGGGLGHLAVQYGLALGARVIAVDTGSAKRRIIESLASASGSAAVVHFIDFATSPDLTADVKAITADSGGEGQGEGAHAVIVTSGHPLAFHDPTPTDLLRVGGTLCCVGIPPGSVLLDVPVATVVIKSLKIVGNLVGSLAETLEAVNVVRSGKVTVHVDVRPFEELVKVYAELEAGEVAGRVVLEVAREG